MRDGDMWGEPHMESARETAAQNGLRGVGLAEAIAWMAPETRNDLVDYDHASIVSRIVDSGEMPDYVSPEEIERALDGYRSPRASQAHGWGEPSHADD